MVKRLDNYNAELVYEHADGDYVSYTDYQALEAENARLHKMIGDTDQLARERMHKLHKEAQRYREALEKLASAFARGYNHREFGEFIRDIAREALEGKDAD